MITGHPPSALLWRFAAGDLPLAPALVIETHVEVCSGCRAVVHRHDDDHGAILADLPDAPLRADALDLALARLNSPRAEGGQRLGDVVLPRALVRQGLHTRRFISAELWAAPVKRSSRDDWRAYVLRAPAGARIPDHRHLGLEYFQVLMGAVVDPELRRAGDFVANPAGGEHALEVTSEGACACLIAVQHGSAWRGLARLATAWLGA